MCALFRLIQQHVQRMSAILYTNPKRCNILYAFQYSYYYYYFHLHGKPIPCHPAPSVRLPTYLLVYLSVFLLTCSCMPRTAVSSSNRCTFRILPLRASTTNVHSNRMCDGDGNGDNDDILTQRFQTKHNPNEMK